MKKKTQSMPPFWCFFFHFFPFETEYNSSVRAMMFWSRLKTPDNEVDVTAIVIAVLSTRVIRIRCRFI